MSLRWPSLRLALAGLALGAAVWGCAAGSLPTVASEGERLEQARRAMSKREYSVAIELLKSYIDHNAGSRDVDEAIYRLGMCYLGTREWPSAQVEFERLLRDYPESDSSGSAAFRLGVALFGQSRPRDFDQEFTTKALEQWRNYLASYPGHWLNPEALRRIGESRARLAGKLADTGRLYLKLKLTRPARVYFQRVLDEYADTPSVGEARLGLALCDALEGRRREAIEQLRRVEADHAGDPVARRAAWERARLERRSG